MNRKFFGKRFLITGGLGFLGSHIARTLLQEGAECFLFDKMDPSRSSAAAMGLLEEKGVAVFQGDLLKGNWGSDLPDDFEGIVHAAGILGIRKVSECPILTADVNVFATKNVLEFAKKQRRLKRFLHFSTSEIYGIEASNAKESDPAVIPSDGNRWIYASSKSFSEHLVRAYRTEMGLPSVIVRPFNVYGPHRQGSNAMTSFIEKALAGEEIFLHGTGKQIRSWCHVEDFCKGILQMLSQENILGEAFNLGSDVEPISILELAQKICSLCKSASKITITHQMEEDVLHRSPNIEKAKKLLSYAPEISLEEGILSVLMYASPLHSVSN